MSEQATEEEKIAVDFVTDAMYTASFLSDFSNYTFSEEREKQTIGQFYDAWIKKVGAPRVVVPYNPGFILGYLYVGILFAKENWFDLLPEDELPVSDEEWGLWGITVAAPQNAKPNIKYVVRRIRNSLGHGGPTLGIPPDATRKNMLTQITFSFHDVNIRDASDTFDITLSLERLMKLVKKFQSVIHRHVREKV